MLSHTTMEEDWRGRGGVGGGKGKRAGMEEG